MRRHTKSTPAHPYEATLCPFSFSVPLPSRASLPGREEIHGYLAVSSRFCHGMIVSARCHCVRRLHAQHLPIFCVFDQEVFVAGFS